MDSNQLFTGGLPTPPTGHGPTDTFAETSALVDSADVSFQKYQDKRSVRVLNKTGRPRSAFSAAALTVVPGDTLTVIQTDVTHIQSYASPLQAVMDSDPAKAIRQTITALVDGIPGLLKVLDDVAQIHPFIKGESGRLMIMRPHLLISTSQSLLARSGLRWSLI